LPRRSRGRSQLCDLLLERIDNSFQVATDREGTDEQDYDADDQQELTAFVTHARLLCRLRDALMLFPVLPACLNIWANASFLSLSRSVICS
jgi:hypothetical protein